MAYIITPYAIAQFAATLISVCLSLLVWRRRYARGGWFLFFLFIAVSLWTFANGMESAAVSQQTKIFWSQIAYIGAQSSPAFLLLFSVVYTGRNDTLTEFKIGMLFVMPIFTIILAATNESHGLIWSGFAPGPAGTNSLIYFHGLFFWVSIFYIYFLVFLATYLLFFFTVRSQRMYQRQNRLVFMAAIFPWIGSVMYLFGLNPFPGLDLISLSFLFTGLNLFWAISKEKLLDVVPIPKEFLVENIENGILVVDEEFRAIEINSSAVNMLKKGRKELIGQSIEGRFSFWDEISPHFNRTASEKVEIQLENPDGVYLQIHISPLSYSRKRFLGWVLVMENITLRKQAELELNNANELLENNLKEIQLLQSKLQEMAIRDPLTGTYNRGYLDDTLMRELARADRQKYPLSILMIDVDNFKVINDSYGHKAGDIVLAGIGKMLLNETRACDCVCRYGGDEFIVVAPEMKKKDAIIRAEKLRETLKQVHYKINGDEIKATISIGIAVYPEDCKDANAIIDAADKALYQAKAAGRDCVRA